MRAAIIALLLAGCAAPADERVGRALPVRHAQDAEQCRAQPMLDWCRR